MYTRTADKIVHARLDEETRGLLERLRRQTGLRESEIIRRGIRALARKTISPAPAEIIGLGAFQSGIPDLGSSKKHLAGFGER